jgi:hypothetical protein
LQGHWRVDLENTRLEVPLLLLITHRVPEVISNHL